MYLANSREEFSKCVVRCKVLCIEILEVNKITKCGWLLTEKLCMNMDMYLRDQFKGQVKEVKAELVNKMFI